ncbi:hypothetical protein [Nocardia otitidiscaviarum]|uniref:hypothetical protein n=1 Tax=Nocardia otitidiscaviarum TaxID=1823 RepID=UPI001FD6275C|nr:hypothetical protein [Nocardia otitidiscaviarum]
MKFTVEVKARARPAGVISSGRPTTHAVGGRMTGRVVIDRRMTGRVVIDRVMTGHVVTDRRMTGRVVTDRVMIATAAGVARLPEPVSRELMSGRAARALRPRGTGPPMSGAAIRGTVVLAVPVARTVVIGAVGVAALGAAAVFVVAMTVRAAVAAGTGRGVTAIVARGNPGAAASTGRPIRCGWWRGMCCGPCGSGTRTRISCCRGCCGSGSCPGGTRRWPPS